MSRVLWMLPLLVLGCQIDQETVTPRAGDAVSYSQHVHPLLEATCATLDCHGDTGRPLRLYAETGLRTDTTLRDLPITDAELARNVASLTGVDPEAPIDRSLVLSKPLAENAGGLDHVGGDLWPSTTDPAYLCVRGWLEGATTAIDAVCAEALAPVRLPDP